MTNPTLMTTRLQADNQSAITTSLQHEDNILKQQCESLQKKKNTLQILFQDGI